MPLRAVQPGPNVSWSSPLTLLEVDDMIAVVRFAATACSEVVCTRDVSRIRLLHRVVCALWLRPVVSRSSLQALLEANRLKILCALQHHPKISWSSPKILELGVENLPFRLRPRDK